MTKQKVLDGAIVSIPCEDTYVVAKVLYVSEYFKNTALLKIYKSRLNIDTPYSDIIMDSSFELVYTGVDLIKKGKWSVVDVNPISDSEYQLSKRIVGGDVWHADECMGRATDSEVSTLPKMKVYNVNAIAKKVSQYPLQ